MLLAASGVSLLHPWPIKYILDSVVDGQAPPDILLRLAGTVGRWTGIASSPKFSLLLVLCLGILLIEALIGVLKVFSTYLLFSAGLRMVFKLRCLVFQHYQRLSLAFHNQASVGDSVYRITSDTGCVQQIFNNGIVPAAMASVTLCGIAYVMLTRDAALAGAALAVGIPLMFLVRGFDRSMTERSLRVNEKESDIHTRIQQTLVGIRTVKAFSREDHESARFRQHARASLHAGMSFKLIESGSQAAVDILLAAGVAAVVWIAGSRVLQGRLTPGDLVLLVSYLWMLYEPLETIAFTAANVQAAAAGARRVRGVLDTLPDIVELRGAVDLPAAVRGHIAFERVSFRYGEGKPVLSAADLDIPAGATVGVVGPSGAGKTTLASLILRFYDPDKGRITLDGCDLRSLTLASLRRNVAWVHQDPVLFDASIEENISYGKPGATKDEIRSAALAAGAHGFIETLPRKYDTRVGMQGGMLSGGQRQRIAIARAFLKDAPVLVLDEPTSSLDVEAEDSLLATLGHLMRGRTTIIISHRPSTLRLADRIVAISENRIVEVGLPEELLSRKGIRDRLREMRPSGAQEIPS
jgi:ABC-type multidrug transport system fused ATPase/permease subunit